MLLNETAHLSWWHDVPTTIRTNYNKFVCLLKLQVLNFRFRDQSNSFCFKITQWSCDSNTRTFLISPNSWWTNLLTFVCKPVNLSSTPLNSLSFIRSDRFVIIWQLNSKFFLWCYSVQNSSWVTQITNKTFISLYKYWYCTSTRTWIIYPTIF